MEQIRRVVGVEPLVVEAHDFQARHLLELLEVVHERPFRGLVGDLPLAQLTLEFLEEGSLVGAELGLDVVLRVEEHLPVRFPDPVVLAPLPLLLLVFVQLRARLLVEKRLLHELLNAADRLLDSRGLLAGAHLRIEKEVVVHLRDPAVVFRGDQIGEQGIPLQLAELVTDGRGRFPPLGLVEGRAHRALDRGSDGLRHRPGTPGGGEIGSHAEFLEKRDHFCQEQVRRLGTPILRRELERVDDIVNDLCVPTGSQDDGVDQGIARKRLSSGGELKVEELAVEYVVAQHVGVAKPRPACVLLLRDQPVEIERPGCGGSDVKEPLELVDTRAEAAEDERNLVQVAENIRCALPELLGRIVEERAELLDDGPGCFRGAPRLHIVRDQRLRHARVHREHRSELCDDRCPGLTLPEVGMERLEDVVAALRKLGEELGREALEKHLAGVVRLLCKPRLEVLREDVLASGRELHLARVVKDGKRCRKHVRRNELRQSVLGHGAEHFGICVGLAHEERIGFCDLRERGDESPDGGLDLGGCRTDTRRTGIRVLHHERELCQREPGLLEGAVLLDKAQRRRRIRRVRRRQQLLERLHVGNASEGLEFGCPRLQRPGEGNVAVEDREALQGERRDRKAAGKRRKFGRGDAEPSRGGNEHVGQRSTDDGGTRSVQPEGRLDLRPQHLALEDPIVERLLGAGRGLRRLERRLVVPARAGTDRCPGRYAGAHPSFPAPRIQRAVPAEHLLGGHTQRAGKPDERRQLAKERRIEPTCAQNLDRTIKVGGAPPQPPLQPEEAVHPIQKRVAIGFAHEQRCLRRVTGGPSEVEPRNPGFSLDEGGAKELQQLGELHPLGSYPPRPVEQRADGRQIGEPRSSLYAPALRKVIELVCDLPRIALRLVVLRGDHRPGLLGKPQRLERPILRGSFGREDLHQTGTRLIDHAEMAPRLLTPEIERQLERMDRIGKLRIRLGTEVFRLGLQILCSPGGLVADLSSRRRDR